MRLRTVLPAAVAVILAVIGVIVLRTGSSSSATTEPTSPNMPVVVDRPGEPEARDFAIDWVARTGDLLSMGPIERRVTLEPLVVPTALEEMLATLESDLLSTAGQIRYPTAELVVSETPLRVDVDAVDDTAAVRVWSVVVFGAQPLGSPRCVWRTVELSLQATSAAWQLASIRDSEGPTPVAIDALPASWEEFAAVADWWPADGSR